MKRAALMLLAACHYVDRPLPDGGREYELPDGGWVSAGVPCGCRNVQQQLVIEQGPDSTVVLECLPNPDFACDARSGQYPDGRPCAGAAACFGERCCVWVP